MDKFCKSLPWNTWPQCLDMGIGQESTKIYKLAKHASNPESRKNVPASNCVHVYNHKYIYT